MAPLPPHPLREALHIIYGELLGVLTKTAGDLVVPRRRRKQPSRRLPCDPLNHAHAYAQVTGDALDAGPLGP